MQSKYAERIEKLEIELADLRKKEEEFQKQTGVEQLAERMHDIQCTFDHNDQCSWYYEKNWNEFTHKRYLEKAEKFIANTPNHTFDERLKLLKILR